MPATSLQHVQWKDVGLLGVGIVAGGMTAAVTDGVLPPVLIMGLALLVVLLVDRALP